MRDVVGVQNLSHVDLLAARARVRSALVATTDALSITVDPLDGTCSAAPLGGHVHGLATITDSEVELFVDRRVVTAFRAASRDAVEEFAASEEEWHQLRFLVPALACESAPIAELLGLADGRYGEHGTPDVVFSGLSRALAAAGDLDGAIEAAAWSVAAGHRTGHLLLGGVLFGRRATGRRVRPCPHPSRVCAARCARLDRARQSMRSAR